MDYEIEPASAQEQHGRVAALRTLIARGIPSILWGEDAMRYAPLYRVPTALFDQQILVPDHLVEKSAAVLREGLYRRMPFHMNHLDFFGPLRGTSPFPKGIRMKHRDIPEEEPYKLFPIPMAIILLPQSYYGMSVDALERLQPLQLGDSLSAVNAGVLIPKYHTFLEGLVHFLMNPPTGLEHHHGCGSLHHFVFLEYLLMYRVGYGEAEDYPPVGELYPAEREILEELQTEEARYFIGTWFKRRIPPNEMEIRDYRAKHDSNPLFVQRNTAKSVLSVSGNQDLVRGRRNYSVATAVTQARARSWGVPHGYRSISSLRAVLPLYRRLLRRP